MTNRDTFQPRKWQWLMTVFLLAPIQLGAKGCDTAVVGADGTGGAAGKPGASSGGSSATGGASSSAGTGGSTNAGTVCGGFSAAQCASGQYCKYAVGDYCGAADATGVCTPRPQQCAEIYQPVCGCDGATYGNECEAAANGVGISANGPCKSEPGVACGGIAGLACDVGEYCNFPTEAQCGAADQTGICEPVPEACDMMYLPVCGCDDKTYGNACSAAAAGVSIAHQGECKSTTEPPFNCGGITGLACRKGEYCNYPKEAQCGAADQMGVCTVMPQACNKMYAPVCGCDGVTYGNACTAAAAGVSIVSEGECRGSTGVTVCGGLAGLACAAAEFCDYPVEAGCGAADQTGVCRTKPEACTMIYAPVCGCDGKTYGNECSAASAGVSVAATGACAG